MRRRTLMALLGVGWVSAATAQVGGPVGTPSMAPRPTPPPPRPRPRPAGPRAAFSPITILPMATRAGGTYNFGPVTIPVGVVGLQATVDLSQAPAPPSALPAITVILEGSLNGGASWLSAGVFTREAGVKNVAHPGSSALETDLVPQFRGGDVWNDAANANRRLRGVASLGGSLRFSLVVLPL